jgi:ABC-type histidine transport system ATPase subunit
MKAKNATTKDRRPARAMTPEIPEFEDVRVIERPDGYYWQSSDGRQERGPFARRLEAEQDLAIYDEDTLEVGETLEEAEAEIGIAEWVDPETGELAEEEVSRIEEH